MPAASKTHVTSPYFEFSPSGFFRLALFAVGALFLANASALFVQHVLGHPEVWGLVPLFHLDREQNIPTFFSALMLLFAAALLLAAAQKAHLCGEKVFPWALLALVFTFLSIDEFASIHERLDALIKHYTPTSGILHHAWVAPYGAAVAVLAFVLCPWFFRLERRLQVLFFASGALFVGGAIGVEIINGVYYSSIVDSGSDTSTLTGDALASIEELGEMTGVSLFIYALLLHISGERGVIRLQAA